MTVYFVVLMIVSKCALTSALIQNIPMPDKMKECFSEMISRSNIKKDPAYAIDYLCVNRYIYNTPELRWKKHVNTSVDANLLKDLKSVKVERSTAKVVYTKRSLLKHLKRNKRQWRPVIRRKEYRTMTWKEMDDFHRALILLKEDKSIQPNVYDALCNLHPNSRAPFAHYGPAFLSWHRVTLFIFESQLRKKVPGVFLPYWDSSLDSLLENPTASALFSSDFLGGGNGVVTDGPFSDWEHDEAGKLVRNIGNSGSLFQKSDLSYLFTSLRSEDFMIPYAHTNRNLELKHGLVHAWVSGTMDNLNYSPADPVFWLHHCFVDYIWEKIRNYQKQHGLDPSFDYPNTGIPGHGADDILYPFRGLRNKDGYQIDWARLVEYEDSPDECGSVEDCDSPTHSLTCDRGLCRASTIYEMQYPNIFIEILKRKRRRASKKSNKKRRSVDDPQLEEIFVKSDSTDVKTSPLFHSYQNTFTINGVEDSKCWIYIPISIYYRRPSEVTYDSHPFKNGRPDFYTDIYKICKPNAYSVGKSDEPATTPQCKHIGSGAFKVFVKSYGLNYDGYFIDYALVDERQPLSVAHTQVGVRNPYKNETIAYISAYDSCGRMCKAKCLVHGSDPPKYTSCSGTLNITSKTPMMYSKNIADANLYTYNYDSIPPTLSDSKIFLVFYCDQEETWPWDGVKYG